MANLVLDYLMAEARDRSQRAIDFPYEYAECYAFMQSGIHVAPGKFYDQANVRPWMPKGLVTTDSIQVNYVAARGDKSLCVALMNECDRELKEVKVRIDLSRFEPMAGASLTARVWRDDQPQAESLSIKDGEFQSDLAPKGITALVIEGVSESFRLSRE
jgi:hypothetical protein